MRSAWFWNTAEWQIYEDFYYGVNLYPSYKSSPLANDHDFSDAEDQYEIRERLSRVIELGPEGLVGVRKSYKHLINRGIKNWRVDTSYDIDVLHKLHRQSAGRETRVQQTWDLMNQWFGRGLGLQVVAFDCYTPLAAAYFIIYQDSAYYASAAKVVDDAMHCIIHQACHLLYEQGITRLEMGDISGETPKEQGIAKFKQGFGGVDVPYLLATRRL